MDDGLLFARVVGALADGMLMFEAPFDFATSVALHDNDETGERAVNLFAGAHPTRKIAFHLRLVQIAPDSPGTGEREVLDTVVSSIHDVFRAVGSLVREIEFSDHAHEHERMT